MDIDFVQIWSPIRLSLQVAAISSVLSTCAGIFIAWCMSISRFPGKVIAETLFMLPLVLPPTVIGFLLLVFLGRNSWVGQVIESIFSTSIIFSWGAAVIASIVVSFPLVYQTMKNGFAAIDTNLMDAARSSGASEWQVFRYVTLPIALPSVMTAYILSFARSLGEFGATLMIAGNIPGKTQTVPTAIFVAVESGNMTMAWLWTISIILISFLLLLLTRMKKTS
ncbi:molybdate ABC transporter permease subunit [Paenibacillus polygoni]|uniref:Molybdenum transport system permease n=1 Tax=Paenibacillus polygoni TaxID=3050112 RepID=A0ABY8X4B5_9BACL|nr:molybdate ABC transporter permease subunit [Paenibacillus polygoni]WIV20285.1 molybdate ABC transporter permease subunit [Paenibacillus polygoni]